MNSVLDIYCILTGLLKLSFFPVLLIVCHKKAGARLLPAFAALAACFPVFIAAGVIRSGFERQHIDFFIKQAVLYSIFEEGAKYLMLRFLLRSYDRPADAVSYGIGHGYFEEFGAAFTCFGLVGTGRAGHDIFWFNLFSVPVGAVSCIAVTVLIFYGIHNGKSIITLPAAMLLHFFGNISAALLMESAAIAVHLVLTAGAAFAAYKCCKAMEYPSRNGM